VVYSRRGFNSQKSGGISPLHFPSWFAFFTKKLISMCVPSRRPYRREKACKTRENCYLLLVVPIGWIKIEGNRRKDHGGVVWYRIWFLLIFFLLGVELLFWFVCSFLLLCERGRVAREYIGALGRDHARMDGEVAKGGE
jgi:hypothetical protein